MVFLSQGDKNMENNINKQSGGGITYTENDLNRYINLLSQLQENEKKERELRILRNNSPKLQEYGEKAKELQEKINIELTKLQNAVRENPKTVLDTFSSFRILSERGWIITPLNKVDSRFINTVLDSLKNGGEISQFLDCFCIKDYRNSGIDSLGQTDMPIFRTVQVDGVTINKNVIDVLEAHPEVLWFTTIFDKEHEGIIDKSYKDGTNKEYMHKAISSLANKGVDEFLSQQQHTWISQRLEDTYRTPDFPRKVFCNDKSFIEELIVGKDGKNSEEKQIAMLGALNYLVTRRGYNQQKYIEEREFYYENMTNFYLNILDLNTKQEDGKVAYIGREFVLAKMKKNFRIGNFIEDFPKVVAQLAIKEYISFQEAKQVEKFADSDIMKVLQNIDPKLLANVAGEVGKTESVSVKEMRAGLEVLEFMEKMIPEKENNIEA